MFASLHTAELATGRIHAVGSYPRLTAYLRAALSARRQRRFLARMDDRSLADIGLTRDQAVSEGNRPLWDVPANWQGTLIR